MQIRTSHSIPHSTTLRPAFQWLRLLLLATGCCWASHASAYEVWMGTSCTPSNAAVYPENWNHTAAQVTGLNINLAPCQPDPGTPCEYETACGVGEWKTIFNQFKHDHNGFVPIPRSAFGPSGPKAEVTLEKVVDRIFTRAQAYGYGLSNIMIYPNALGTNLYVWTQTDLEHLRNYLNSSGHTGVGILYNARNFSEENQAMCTNRLVDHVLLEAEPGKWFNNTGSRQDLLRFLWTNELTVAKQLIFQIPVSGSDPYGSPNGFQQVRRLVRWLGTDLMGWDFLRSSRVVFMPVTYNSPTVTFYPETASPNLYTNTMTSLVLSLIEQRDLFEARTTIPTQADADSFVRGLGVPANAPPTISAISDQVLPLGVSQLHFPLTVADDLTPAASLTVHRSSSNTSFVPDSNIVLGGSGSSRSLTITLNPLLTGSTTITLTVGDGTHTTTHTFWVAAVVGNRYQAVLDGLINEPQLWWGLAAPLPGDTNDWSTGGFDLQFGTESFSGRTFALTAGSELTPAVAGAAPFFRNFTFDGGILLNSRNTQVNLNFSGSNVTVTAAGGALKCNADSRNLQLKNGRLVGSGNLLIAPYTTDTSAYSANVIFADDMDLTGYTGTMTVAPTNEQGALVRLRIYGATSGSFGVVVEDGGLLWLPGDNLTNTFASLTLGTNRLAAGVVYTRSSLNALGLGGYVYGTVGAIAVAAIPGVHVAVKSGGINTNDTWNIGTAPVSGDTNAWKTAGFNLTFLTESFLGRTFVLCAGSELTPAVAGAAPIFRNFTFDGGTLLNNRNLQANLDFSGSNVTVTAAGGALKCNAANRNLQLANGRLVGSGNLVIAPQTTLTDAFAANVIFAADMDLTGYSGTMTVAPTNEYGGVVRLRIYGATSGSFDVVVEDGGLLWLPGDNLTNTFASVTLGTTPLAAGVVYNRATLNALGLGGYVYGTVGSIAVAAPPPPPTLTIRPWTGHQVRIAWLGDTSGFSLQRSPVPHTGFTNASLAVSVEGLENAAYDTPDEGACFYRLVK